MKIIIQSSGEQPSLPIQVVERKGIGHPDSICDGLAEAISQKLSRYYLEHFERILHHNVDKVLLRGGSSNPAFGGGVITAPIEICLAGRATHETSGKKVPVKELALEAAAEWFQKYVPGLAVGVDVRLNCLIRPGSQDLVELFLRQREPLANDTSVGVGFAPFSALERAVLQIDGWLHSKEAKERHPQVGSDTKVMGDFDGAKSDLTVACAFIDKHVLSLEDYFSKKDSLFSALKNLAGETFGGEVALSLNAADDRARGSIYLTVSGTSAEAGDDGEVGRGNRITGLITPHRPMSLEAAAGKNPVSHTGKIYQIAAQKIAERLTSELTGLGEAQVFLLSQIGSPISEPKLASVQVRSRVPLDTLKRNIEEILRAELNNLPQLTNDILTGKRMLF